MLYSSFLNWEHEILPAKAFSEDILDYLSVETFSKGLLSAMHLMSSSFTRLAVFSSSIERKYSATRSENSSIRICSKSEIIDTNILARVRQMHTLIYVDKTCALCLLKKLHFRGAIFSKKWFLENALCSEIEKKFFRNKLTVSTNSITHWKF